MEQIVYKICLIGDTGVGKSSILKRYIENRFDPYSDSTIGAQFLCKHIIHKNTHIKLELWDTAGQERYRSIVSLYYRNCNAVLLVVDITNAKSMESIFYWTNELHRNIQDTPIFLVFNKMDMRQTEADENDIHSTYGEYNVTNVSAKTNYNINELFEKVIETIHDGKKQENEPFVILNHDIRNRYKQWCYLL